MAHGGEVIVRPAELDESALDAFAELVRPGVDTGGGLRSVADVLAGAQIFQVEVRGEVVMRYALRADAYEHGIEGAIVGAVGRMPLPFAQVEQIIAGQFIEARAIQVMTRRRGMVKQLARCGYGIEGFLMRKHLKAGTA